MKRKWIIAICIWFLLFLTACHKDILEPETKNFGSKQHKAIEVSGMLVTSNDSFMVKHLVKENDVYIECIVKDASFRNKEVKLLVYVDGQKTLDISNAAFVVKDLTEGEHKIKLNLINLNQNKIVATKELAVVIK